MERRAKKRARRPYNLKKRKGGKLRGSRKLAKGFHSRKKERSKPGHTWVKSEPENSEASKGAPGIKKRIRKKTRTIPKNERKSHSLPRGRTKSPMRDGTRTGGDIKGLDLAKDRGREGKKIGESNTGRIQIAGKQEDKGGKR